MASSIVKKPADVIGGAGKGFWEGFQLLYGLSEMGYKFHLKKLAGEKYITDSIGNVVSSFRLNPTNLEFNDAAIDSMEKIGKGANIDPNSKAGILWQQSYKQLKLSRENTLLVQEKLEGLPQYVATKYIDIPNEKGWEPVDVRDKDGNIIRPASKERSKTVQTINQDIAQLKADKREIHSIGRLDAHTHQMFDKQINELERVKSWVGYDGRLKQQDLSHMDNNTTLAQAFTGWESTLGKLKTARTAIIAEQGATSERLFGAGENAYEQDEWELEFGFPRKLKQNQDDIDNMQSLVDRYEFDYRMINKMPVELSEAERNKMLASEGYITEKYSGGIPIEALNAYSSSDVWDDPSLVKKAKGEEEKEEELEKTPEAIALTVEDVLAKYVPKGKLGPLEKFSVEGSIILPEKKEVHLAISGFGQQMEQSEGMIKNLQYQDRKGEWKPRDANKLKREARKFKEILKDVKNVVENIDSSSSKTNKRIYKKLKRFVYHQKELAGPQTPFVVGGGTGAYDFDPEIKEIIDSIDIGPAPKETSASDVAKDAWSFAKNFAEDEALAITGQKRKIFEKYGQGMLTGGTFLKQF